MCCLYKMKLGTRRTAETTTKILNNGLACRCFIALLRLPHMRLAIALNLEGKSCDLNNQWAVGPGAMASGMLSDMKEWSPAHITVSVCSVVDMAESRGTPKLFTFDAQQFFVHVPFLSVCNEKYSGQPDIPATCVPRTPLSFSVWSLLEDEDD